MAKRKKSFTGWTKENWSMRMVHYPQYSSHYLLIPNINFNPFHKNHKKVKVRITIEQIK